jgi:hyperosmotically inducible periplasmic protein
MSRFNVLATTVLTAALAAAAGCASSEGQQRSAGQTVDDAGLVAKVKAALVENDQTKARNINVDVRNGQVQLNGFVDSTAEKEAAAKAARSVSGVRGVDNNLEVKAGTRTAGEVLDDGMITAKVKTALIADSRTKAHQIEVTTNSGIVQLGGFVDSAEAKAAANEVAKSVSGVKDVHNELAVKKAQ